MTFTNRIGLIGRVTLSTMFWLCIQVCIILAVEILRLLPSNLFHVGLYGIQGSIAGYVYTWACCIVGLVYTMIGSIILEKIPINTKRWWITVGICYTLYMILTAVGMLTAHGAWFWEGYGVFLLDVWLAPLLWLGEIELVHLYWSKQRKEYLDCLDAETLK